MNSEEMSIISFIFKRSGKDRLSESEIYLPLSLELRWFSSTEAKNFVKYATQTNLLNKEDGFLSPSFDVSKIKVPIGFQPSKKDFKIEKSSAHGQQSG